MTIVNTMTPREAIQRGFSAINSTSVTINAKVHDVAQSVEHYGFGDRVTTRQIRRALIASGRG